MWNNDKCPCYVSSLGWLTLAFIYYEYMFTYFKLDSVSSEEWGLGSRENYSLSDYRPVRNLFQFRRKMYSLILLADIYLSFLVDEHCMSTWQEIYTWILLEQNGISFGLIGIIKNWCLSCHDGSISFGWCFVDLMIRYALTSITLYNSTLKCV